MKEHVVIYTTAISTPIGKMTACATNEGICLLEFDERPDIKKQISSLVKYVKGKIIPGVNSHLLNLQSQIDQYFKKEIEKFDLPLVFAGTDFQMNVWKALQKIPYGKTETYLSLTRKLGDEKAIRAVAGANGANKMAILVPCHRVVGFDGKLVGYAGGLWRKEWLLDHESGQEMMGF
jgi:O-6-methylguanine DNA methyltransferase